MNIEERNAEMILRRFQGSLSSLCLLDLVSRKHLKMLIRPKH